jgi:protein subunit release factor B
LKIKKEAEVVEVLSSKIAELQEKREEQERNERRREKEKVERREEMERAVEKKKQESEISFDWKTPCAHFFLAKDNNITF